MPTVRNIVMIDEEKCTGCGLCVPACEEGAIQIIDGKARLVSDVYCDGLGNCLGKCPEDAITLEPREAEAFDLQAVERRLAGLGSPHPGAQSPVPGTCPGSAARSLTPSAAAGGCPGSADRVLERPAAGEAAGDREPRESRLGNWPVQLRLVPVEAPYFTGAHLLIAADCTPLALADFHDRLLADRVLVIGCPKLDDVDLYVKKLAQVFMRNDLRSIEVVHMEVPCCFGLVHIVAEALKESGREIPATVTQVGIRGEVQETSPLAVGVG